MKKGLVVLVILTFILSTIFVGCTKVSKDEVVTKGISELKEDVLVGETENFNVKVSVYKKENPYIDDGIAGKLEKYIDISVVLKKEIENVSEFQYVFSLGDKVSQGLLKASVFADSYQMVLKNFEYEKGDANIEIKGGDFTQKIELKSVLNEKDISYKEALEVAKKELQSELDELTVDNKLNAEIHLKLINSASNLNSKYYWYVLVISSDKKKMALLIDPSTSEIAVKKIS